jgi:hypothetical protein
MENHQYCGSSSSPLDIELLDVFSAHYDLVDVINDISSNTQVVYI